VNFDTKEVRITQSLQWVARKPVFVEPKTKQSRRTFALSPDMAKRLKQHRKAQLQERLLAGGNWDEHGLVFTTRTGRPLDGINVTRDFKRMLKNAELPVLRFHDLRHTAASFLLFQKVPPRVVMELLGHSGIRVTMDLYSHVAPVCNGTQPTRWTRCSGQPKPPKSDWLSQWLSKRRSSLEAAGKFGFLLEVMEPTTRLERVTC
jgi:integrase